MKKAIKRLALLLSLGLMAQSVSAQPQKKPSATPQKPATVEQVEPPAEQDVETINTETDLVTVPVIASSHAGKYIADLTKEEFRIFEDGTPQEIAFLATVNAPFHVVLLLDTSSSTQEKLPMIQRAAITFVEALGAADKVKLISFDDSVKDWNEFTSDKAIVRKAILQTTPGQGTMIYDAVERALNTLRLVSGRRAIVVFSDGMDWHSDMASFEGTLKSLEESGVIIYPIRFETRAETEALARRQAQEQQGIGLPTSDVVRQGGGTTPSTFPSDDPSTNPQGRPTSWPDMIFRRPNVRPPAPAPRTSPTDDHPDMGNRLPPPGPPTERGRTERTRRADDSIKAMLDQAYLMADSYLKELAERSGGQVYRADTVSMLPLAFAAIAAELRTQYSLGYYPTNREKKGTYRKIQVKTSRKDVAVRARPGYRR